MEIITERTLCTGCGICAAVCPTGSIAMQADEKGFLYPYIHATTCCQCGKCTHVCPVLHAASVWQTQSNTPKVYAAWSSNQDLRYVSTSGGIFSELAQDVLRNGGYVAGARYDTDFLVKHVLIDHIRDLPLLQQSKYTQSRSGSIYLEVEEKLREGRQVLFVGTPCQCAALQRGLRKEYRQLLLCDFICRGVNAPVAYLAYLHGLEEQYCSKIARVWFKNKKNGWTQFGTRIDFENGQTYFGDRYTDDFMYGFIRKNLNLYLRPSCTQCSFKGIGRPTDLTLGDFWGMSSQSGPDLGVSIVLVHTKKGQQAFSGLSGIVREEKNISDALSSNACLEGCVSPSAESAYFWQQVQQGVPFHEIMQKVKNNPLRKDKRNE